MALNDQIFNNATQTREEASEFEKDLKKKFDMLSEKTTENLNRSNEMLEVAKQQAELENDIANSVAVITAMFSKNAMLESTVMPQVVNRLSIKPPKPIDTSSQNDDVASPPPAQAPTPNNPQWWEFWKPKNNNSNSTPSSVSSPSVGNIKPPPSNLASGGFTPAQSYSDSTAKEKNKIKKDMISYADIIQKPLEASGMYAISILGDFISSTGGLGGFFKPYIKTVVSPFADSMGVSKDFVDRLLSKKVNAAEIRLFQQQKDFTKTWGSYLNDDNFIAKFITRESDSITTDSLNRVDSSTAEQNLAAFVATLESSQLQDQADVFQSMLNRAGQNYGNYGGLFEQLTSPNQYSPLSAIIHGTTDPNAQARYGPIAAKMGSNPEERIAKLKEIISRGDALTELEDLYQAGNAENAAKLLQDFRSGGELSKESQRFIRGRTDFGAESGVGGAQGGNQIRRSSNTFGARGANLPPSSLESGGFENLKNNIRIFNPLVISGPNIGYPLQIGSNLVTMHGMEILIPYGKGYYVLPIKNNAYSFKNPEELLGRWYDILTNKTKSNRGFAAGGRITPAEYWQTAAITAREDTLHPQGQADVAQSLYNRMSVGSYPGGRNLLKIITAPGQFEPTFKNPAAWAAIRNRQTAIAAVGSQNLVDMAARSISSPSLQQEAARFVGGRTDFMGESQKPYMKPGDITRGKNHNFFGWFYDSRLAKPAAVPKFVAAQTTSTATSNRTRDQVIINRSPSSRSSSTNLIQQSSQFISDTVRRFNPLQFMFAVQRGRS